MTRYSGSMRILILALALIACALAQKPASNKPVAEPKPATAQAQVIDINSATEAELRTVPGIGEAYAKKIIAARPYRAKNELVQKKVLPAGVYDKVKDRLIAKQK
jgi:competence protein ComEA